MLQINIKNIFFNSATNSDCIHMARTFQRTLYNMCSKGDKPMFDKIFKKKVETAARNNVGTSALSNQIVDNISNDANTAGRSNKIAYMAETGKNGAGYMNMKNEKDTFKTKPIDLNNKKHGPSRDSDSIKLDRVIKSMMLNRDDLDAAIFFA